MNETPERWGVSLLGYQQHRVSSQGLGDPVPRAIYRDRRPRHEFAPSRCRCKMHELQTLVLIFLVMQTLLTGGTSMGVAPPLLLSPLPSSSPSVPSFSSDAVQNARDPKACFGLPCAANPSNWRDINGRAPCRCPPSPPSPFPLLVAECLCVARFAFVCSLD